MTDPISPGRIQFIAKRAMGRVKAKQVAKVKAIRRNARGGVKHAAGSTKPPISAKRTTTRSKAKTAKASRRRNR